MDIKLKDFEGPLDLLLHLVSQYKVDIYDVPITEVIEQYLVYIAGLQAMKLEVAGDYMLMASQLMLIKSRKLLPTVVETVDAVEEDPELALLNQIEAYRQYKLLSEKMDEQHQDRAKCYAKPKTELISEEVVLNQDKNVLDIFMAFSKVMTQKQEILTNSHTAIARENFRIEDMMARLETALDEAEELHLEALFESCHSKDEMITLFLATLELVKRQQVFAQQLGQAIVLRKVEESHDTHSSD
ncbi:segregation/condensation protein A [Streptococcus sp. DD12]|uniref:segregation/condensation protein A n=1 Tax=Streptococcus sp. DD12 TaxID=1777880 RepID=UPI000798C8B4|nr:segregation/condensation protein A [Streptococcus sp. DD12]KXT75664.1 Segregation and condensation protein A [Streptococcus sp. DD12]